jgi:hypothetical protein
MLFVKIVEQYLDIKNSIFFILCEWNKPWNTVNLKVNRIQSFNGSAGNAYIKLFFPRYWEQPKCYITRSKRPRAT